MSVRVVKLSYRVQGAVWTMEFSQCGKLLASGGQDNVLRVWVLKDFVAFFQQMRDKYNEGECDGPALKPQDISILIVGFVFICLESAQQTDSSSSEVTSSENSVETANVSDVNTL